MYYSVLYQLQHTCTHTRTDLVDSGDLALNAVVLDAGATRALVPRHVDTHHMLASGEILGEKTNTPNSDSNSEQVFSVECVHTENVTK